MKQKICITQLNYLSSTKIKLICIDFDDTLLSINTFGKWEIDPLELIDYVRPEIIKFIKNSLIKKKYVAIVSYSSQSDVIYKCLQYFLKDDISKIYIMTSNKLNQCDQNYCKNIKKDIIMKRKNPMILSVCTKIFLKYNEKIKPYQVLLIDNDINNIRIAQQSGFNTFYVNINENMNNIKSKMINFFNKKTHTFIYASSCKLIVACCLFLFLFFNKKHKIIKKLVTYNVK